MIAPRLYAHVKESPRDVKRTNTHSPARFVLKSFFSFEILQTNTPDRAGTGFFPWSANWNQWKEFQFFSVFLYWANKWNIDNRMNINDFIYFTSEITLTAIDAVILIKATNTMS